jgi:hypothetical protein
MCTTPLFFILLLKLVADGCVGECWIASPSVAVGYWGMPDVSTDTFRAQLATTTHDTTTSDSNGNTADAAATVGVADIDLITTTSSTAHSAAMSNMSVSVSANTATEAAAAVNYLRTGDLAYIQHGNLFICGRSKDVIISHGANFYPQDIEFAAQEGSPAVRPGCVAAFSTSETSNDGELEVVFEIRPSSEKDAFDIVTAVQLAVARDAGLLPVRVCAIKEKSIPKTTSGKIQRRRTREALHAGELQVVCDRSFQPLVAAASSDDDDAVDAADDSGAGTGGVSSASAAAGIAAAAATAGYSRKPSFNYGKSPPPVTRQLVSPRSNRANSKSFAITSDKTSSNSSDGAASSDNTAVLEFDAALVKSAVAQAHARSVTRMAVDFRSNTFGTDLSITAGANNAPPTPRIVTGTGFGVSKAVGNNSSKFGIGGSNSSADSGNSNANASAMMASMVLGTACDYADELEQLEREDNQFMQELQDMAVDARLQALALVVLEAAKRTIGGVTSDSVLLDTSFIDAGMDRLVYSICYYYSILRCLLVV